MKFYFVANSENPIIQLAGKPPSFLLWLGHASLAVLAQATTSPGQTFGVSIFNPSFQESLGISLSQLTGTYMIGTLMAAVPQPYIGGLMDRFGIRRTMTGVVILLGVACIYTATVQSLWMLLIAFFLLRMFGQGALSLLANNIPAMWFQTRLGRVAGFMNIGVAAAIAIIPPMILWLITQYGWRWAYAFLGIAVWVILLPILMLLFRNRPEDVGQVLDGLSFSMQTTNPVPVLSKPYTDETCVSFDLKAAQRTRAYWIMMATQTLFAMIATAIFFNLLPLFTSKGLTTSQAAATYTTLAIATAITQLIAGALADRAPLNWLLSLSLFSLIGSISIILFSTPIWLGTAYAILMGMTQGFGGVVGGTLWARYYGREHLGKIRGSIFTAGVAGSSVGPFIMGLIYDNTGSYQISLWLFIALLIPVAIAALWATPPTSRK